MIRLKEMTIPITVVFKDYLRRFAYMGSSSPDPRLSSLTNPEDVFRMAVRKFQRMARINETGE